MKKLLLVLFAILVNLSTYAETELEKYAGLKYGMTKEEVEVAVRKRGSSIKFNENVNRQLYGTSTDFKLDLDLKCDNATFYFDNDRRLKACKFITSSEFSSILKNLEEKLSLPTTKTETEACWKYKNETVTLFELSLGLDDFPTMESYLTYLFSPNVSLTFSLNESAEQSSLSQRQDNIIQNQDASNGVIKLSGYTYEWDDYHGISSEKDNGSLKLEYRTKNHYIGVVHNIDVTNISARKMRDYKWSTRKGAIKVTFPKGVSVNKDDEIICWESNGGHSDPNYRSVVLFIWTPSTNQLQCLRTCRRYWGRILNDVYYFRTIDPSAWIRIKPILLRELPYSATRID